MEDIISYICGELSVISAIGSGQKLKVSLGKYGDHLTVDNTILPGLTRMISRNSRESGISTVKKIITFALELHNLYFLISHKLIGCANVYPRSFDKLESELNKVISGLNNISVTYADDKTVLIEIKDIIDKIESRQASIY